MTEAAAPRLAEVYPVLVDYLKTELMELGEQSLVDALRELPYLGWCECSWSCTYVRTGDAERAGDAWIHLDEEDIPSVWLQLDRDRASIVGMEIHEFELRWARPRSGNT
ncbi:hypothetical protein [Actinospica robiniae]|uniref:hypothetical protein n=1 Tax=Actinospica robiniae TaxID=304901 RepID=UPI000410D5E2|nr:hypothetical protein [Actinospica robiniae]